MTATATKRAKPAAKATTPPVKAAAAKRVKAAPSAITPGWYIDPADSSRQRWWDGEGWVGAALPASATPPDGPPGEDDEDEAPASRQPGVITFRGRKMKVSKPGPDQLGMWAFTADQMTSVGKSLTANDLAKANKLFARAFKLITSVLIDEDDRDWLQDEITDGKFSLEQAADILPLTIKAHGMDKATAPRNGPRPKARRGR